MEQFLKNYKASLALALCAFVLFTVEIFTLYGRHIALICGGYLALIFAIPFLVNWVNIYSKKSCNVFIALSIVCLLIQMAIGIYFL